MSSTAATPTSGPGFTPQMAKETLAYLRRAIEKMKALQATEKALARIERVMLNRAPEKFELKRLVAAINALNLALREKAETKIQADRALVNQELEAALQALTQRDEAVLPSHLRQYCERDSNALNLNTLAALTSFYRLLPHTSANRGKYDFVVTRLFSSSGLDDSPHQRQLRASREQIAKRLTEMYAAWGEPLAQDSAAPAQITAILARFKEFIAEVNQIQKFEELVGQFFFQRVREFKVSVGPLLYLPEVTAASVESNILIANRFWFLLEQESDEFSQTSEAFQHLVNAFSDTYGNEPDEISRLLAELQTGHQEDEIAQARVLRLTRLLQSANQPEPEAHLPALPLPALLPEVEPAIEAPPEPVFAETSPALVEEPACQTFIEEPEFQALAEDPENEAVLTAYRQASPEARKLELSSFLAPLPDGGHEELQREGRFRRAALALIFQTDQLIQTELSEDTELGDDIESRVDTLFDALGQRSDEMRDLIKVALKLDQSNNYEVLLYVYNQLMSSRLRLQSAIVRRTSSELDETNEEFSLPPQPRIQRAASPQEGADAPAENSPAAPQAAATARRKWLIITALFLAVVAVGMRLVFTSKPAVAKDDPDVVRLMKTQVPNGELFTDIKLHRDLLLCIATEQWLTLSSREQKEKLGELLRFGQEQGATRVLLLDAKGVTVGSATKDDLYVN